MIKKKKKGLVIGHLGQVVSPYGLYHIPTVFKVHLDGP